MGGSKKHPESINRNVLHACEGGLKLKSDEPTAQHEQKERKSDSSLLLVKLKRFTVFVIQHPHQSAVCDLLPSCGRRRQERVGVCLGEILELQQHLRERAAPKSSGLLQEDLAAQQVSVTS